MIDRLALRAIDRIVPPVVTGGASTLPEAQARYTDAHEWNDVSFELGFGATLVVGAVLILRNRRNHSKEP
jgi:hypothetical protein